MSPHENPFRPTFGVPPLFWVGRTAAVSYTHLTLPTSDLV